MVAKKIEHFGGMIPAIDANLLPETAAANAQNTWLYSGAIAGTNTPTLIKTLQSSTTKVYRIPNNFADSAHLSDATWIEFANGDTDTLRTPVVGDTFFRYYFASPTTQPTYNTQARIVAGNAGANAPFLLGIPAPSVAPSVVPAGGASATNRTSAYVYTWVSAYGEEGPPSPPTVATGKIDATWNITVSAAVAGDLGTNRNLTKVRIYRTITSTAGVATFFLVVEQNIATLTYPDTQQDSTVAQNNQLLSTNWSAPPTDLQGFVQMPNGIFAGFRQNEIWFCEPYRPHAWPAIYALAVDYPIVGVGVIGQMLVVCTQSYPYAIFGIHPASMSQTKLATIEPCLSRGSIVSAPEGVYYASSNGLILVNSSGTIANITLTSGLITKDKWLQLLNATTLATLRAARLAGAYYAWGSVRTGVFQPTAFEPTAFAQQDFTGAFNGFLLDTRDKRVAFTLLTNAIPMTNSLNDPWSGELFIIRAVTGVTGVYWLDISSTTAAYETFKWKSRKFQMLKKENLGVLKVFWDQSPALPALNPTPNFSLNQTLAADQWGLVRCYADDVLIWTRELRSSGELMRLPSGRKPDYYQFEFEARVYIKSLQFGSTAKELAGV